MATNANRTHTRYREPVGGNKMNKRKLKSSANAKPCKGFSNNVPTKTEQKYVSKTRRILTAIQKGVELQKAKKDQFDINNEKFDDFEMPITRKKGVDLVDVVNKQRTLQLKVATYQRELKDLQEKKEKDREYNEFKKKYEKEVSTTPETGDDLE